jgi:hypothetical protein
MGERKKGKAGSNAPENDPSKPMDSKREVDKSNDEKIDQDFPGYPHYPRKEDIMDKRTDIHRVDMEVENIPNSKNTTGVSQRFTPSDLNDDAGAEKPDDDDYRDIGPRTEISKSDLKILDSTNAEIGIPQNADNDDLNIDKPGTDLDEEVNDADVTPEERMVLEDISLPTRDENNLKRAALDNTDFDGEELNEDRFPKNCSIQYVTNCAIRALPHLFKVELFYSSFIRRDSSTLNTYTILLNSVGGINCNLIISIIPVFNTQIIILYFEI